MVQNRIVCIVILSLPHLHYVNIVTVKYEKFTNPPQLLPFISWCNVKCYLVSDTDSWLRLDTGHPKNTPLFTFRILSLNAVK